MSEAADRTDVKSSALILHDLQRAIISGSPLAPSEPDALARFDQILRGRSIGTVVLGGLVTHYAVDGTARDAHDRGYRVIVLTDACASATASRHDASLANLAFLAEAVTTEIFASRIGASRGAP